MVGDIFAEGSVITTQFVGMAIAMLFMGPEGKVMRSNRLFRGVCSFTTVSRVESWSVQSVGENPIRSNQFRYL